jgi:hypothetical protein
MWLYLAPILFILVILYVAHPFLMDVQQEQRKERRLTRREKADRVKDEVFATLKDIEMDYHMGKLSEDDYRHLRSEFEERAIEAFDEVDRLNKKRASKTTS